MTTNSKYYTSTEHLLKVFERDARQMAYKAENVCEHEEWKAAVRNKLTGFMGMDMMERCALNPVTIESKQLDGYKRDKIIIQTEPDVWMPLYAFIPDGIKAGEKRPAFIRPHGHSAGKYSTAAAEDMDDVPLIKEFIEKNKKRKGIDFTLTLVRNGFITFCPDARGAGERREWTKQSENYDDFVSNTCRELNHMAISLGQSLAGMMAWDLRRLIDYIETREDCDSGRIGCGGMSGGGMQTLYLSALDDRVKCAVISGYFYGFKDSLLKLPHNCSCNFIPNLWRYADMGDLGALIAPRPLMIESGTNDPLNGENGTGNVYPQVETARNAYKLFGREDRLFHHVFTGGHEWNGEKAFPFIEKWL